MSQWLSFTRTRSGTGRERALDRSVGFGRHQPAKPVILSGMSGIDRIGLILVDDSGHAFHVDGDVDPHDGSRWWAPGAQYRGGRAMHARMWGTRGALAAVGAAPRGTSSRSRLVLEQGRLYTTWLYGNEYNKLWDRFSPEMRQTFGSVGELASFAGRRSPAWAESRVRGRAGERAEPFLVYTRTASFNKAQHPMLIEWSLAGMAKSPAWLLRPATPTTAQ